MGSPAQIQSARLNGAHSDGPVTPEGKQKSSRNATRHGILSNTVVLEGESKERFEQLLASFTAELRLRNTIEATLVETMAVARWRYLRVLSIQKAQFDMEMAREAAVPSAPARAAIAFQKLGDKSRVLDVRYEVSFDLTRALNMLMKLRASADIFPAEAVHSDPATDEFPNEPAACPPQSVEGELQPARGFTLATPIDLPAILRPVQPVVAAKSVDIIPERLTNDASRLTRSRQHAIFPMIVGL